MKISNLKTLFLGTGLALLIPVAFAHGQIRSYDVNFASSAPTLDGVVSPGEWGDAAAAKGAFTLLREAAGTPDIENNRFQAMWDNDGLYVLFESDYTNWSPDPGTMNPAPVDFGSDNWTIYFDPNTLGEANGQLDAEVDAYQVVFNQFAGQQSCGADGVALTADDCSFDNRVNPGDTVTQGTTLATAAEAHVDGLFGNQAEWAGMRLTEASMSHGANGGVTEVKFAWGDFDALATTTDAMNPVDTGLNHPMAPNADDTWFVNVARISSDIFNNLPVWNYTGSQFFASQGDGAVGEGHGEWTFVGGASGPDGDFNGDSAWDCADIDALVAEVAAGTNDPAFDMNGDGVVDAADVLGAGGWLEVGGANNPGQTSGGNSFLVGDATLDGVVDGLDFIEWNDSKFTSTPAWCSGDFNVDGIVDGLDFIEWNDNKFTNADGVAVPEPAAFAIAMLAGLALLPLRRR